VAIHKVCQSVTVPSRALGLFTDREKETRHFLTYLNSDPTPEKVLFFWGEGGNGKSLFLNYLRKYFCKLTGSIEDWNELSGLNNEELVSNFKHMEEEFHPVKQTFLDFEIYLESYRPKDSIYALMQLRRDLSGCGISFPLFDFAAALYLHKTNRLDKQKDLFPKEIMDLGTELAVALLEHTPGVKIVKSFLNVINKHYSKSIILSMKESKGAKIDEEIVQKLYSMDPEKELVCMLPNLFASDLNNSMGKVNVPKRVVLFFDTHEAFWGTRERHLADHHLFERDEWLREFIGLLDLDKGIIVVVAGRERPKWSTPKINHHIPKRYIDTQLIGHFTETDARGYLEKSDIRNDTIQCSLIELAKVETDQIHPFYLGLCVDIILQANLNGISLSNHDINQWLKDQAGNKEQELIKRFLKYVDTVDLANCIKAVSLCRSFDFELYFELGKKLNLLVSEPLFKTLINFSFVKEFKIVSNKYKENKVYRIHDLLRRVINEQDEEFVTRAHKVIESYYREKIKEGNLTALGEAIYHKTQVNKKNGANEWVDKFEEALEQSNFQLCSILQNLSFDLKVDDSSSADFAYFRGSYLLAISRYKEAIEELTFSIKQYSRVLLQDSNNIGTFNHKCLALTRLGDLRSELSQQHEAKESYSQAIAEYEKVLTLDPDDIGTLINKGNCLQSLGHLQANISQQEQARVSYSQAIEAYNKALCLAPYNIKAHNNKGNSLQSLGHMLASISQHEQAKMSYSQGIEEYDKVLRIAPDFIVTYNNKGLALESLGHLQASISQHEQAKASYSQAIEAYDKVLSLAPDFIAAHNNKGLALKGLGDLQTKLSMKHMANESYTRAIKAYDKVLILAPNDTATHINKGSAQHSLGDLLASISQQEQAKVSYFQAIKAYDKALSLAPDYSSAHYNKGNALKRLGDLQASLLQSHGSMESYFKAITVYDKAISLAPNHFNAHNSKGEALQSLGDLQTSLSQKEQAEESYTYAIASYDHVLRIISNETNAKIEKGKVIQKLTDLRR